MAYIKGGAVVDGNLYVEGNLNIRGQSSEEGVRYTYILNPGAYPNSLVKIATDNSGALEPTGLTEAIDNGNVVLSKRVNGDLTLNMLPGVVEIGTSEVEKNILYAYDENGAPIANTDNSEPLYWQYDTSRAITLTGRRAGNNVNYTLDANEPGVDIYVGETVNVSGVPENSGE